MAVVGLNGHVITERSQTTPPSQQLQEARPFFKIHSARNFSFTHNVCMCDPLQCSCILTLEHPTK